MASAIAAGLFHRRGPAIVQRLHRLLPLGELLGRQLIDLVAGQRLHLDAAVGLEFGPGIGDLGSPFRRAVIVDDLLLRRRQRIIFVQIDVVGEYRRIERHVHVVLHDLVDTEQENRTPGEGDLVGDATLDRVARFRSRGLNVGAAEHFHHLADGALGGAHFQPLEIGRDQNFLLAVQRAGIVDECETEVGVLHLGRRIFVVPLVQRQGAFLAVGEHEGKLAGSGDRETTGLIAGIDIGDVGDAVPRHVVMVECLAELFGGKHGNLDGAARGFLDIGGPCLRRRYQRMRRGHPQRHLHVDGLVLRQCRRHAGGQQQRQNRFSHRHLSL